MTKRVTITEAEIRRVIRAARSEGLHSTEIRRADGTVISFKLQERASSSANDIDERASAYSKWNDVAA